MKTTMGLTSALLLLVGCGGGDKGPVDAGIDDSCGIDCAAQADYGLIAGKCFEYSATDAVEDPPAIGALVNPVITLEGGVKVMQVSYRQGGLTKMTDSFTIKDGDLYLVRREWGPGQSVTYRDDANVPSGVLWVRKGTGVGENFATSSQADVINAGARNTVATNYSISTVAATATELKTPLQTYTDALKLLITEAPNHGADSRRVLVRQTGFIFFSSPFDIAGGTATQLKLQKIKDVPAGTFECG